MTSSEFVYLCAVQRWKAIALLFRRINVNQKRDPELDAVIDTLAGILHGIEKARADRSLESPPPRHSRDAEMSLTVEEVPPENDPFGEPESVLLSTRDAGSEKKVLRAVIPTKLPEN